MPTHKRSYVALTVTLTDANANYNLLALINAIVEAETKYAGANCPGMCRELNIQSDVNNTAQVIVGDGLLSATRVGYFLAIGGARAYRSEINNVDLGSLYVRSTAAAQKLNVEVVCC